PHHLEAELEVVYQTLDNLHKACPKHLGDWYFSGNYPTPGGNKVVNRAFMNWVEGKNVRAYFSSYLLFHFLFLKFYIIAYLCSLFKYSQFILITRSEEHTSELQSREK